MLPAFVRADDINVPVLNTKYAGSHTNYRRDGIFFSYAGRKKRKKIHKKILLLPYRGPTADHCPLTLLTIYSTTVEQVDGTKYTLERTSFGKKKAAFPSSTLSKFPSVLAQHSLKQPRAQKFIMCTFQIDN